MLEEGVLPVGLVFIAIVGTTPVLNASKVCVPFDVTLVPSPSSSLRYESAFAGMEFAIVLFAILSYHTPDPRQQHRLTVMTKQLQSGQHYRWT